MVKDNKYLKTIIADTDLDTFKALQSLNDKYNIIFLSSDFAVNFMLEYEKIDLVIISNRIPDLNGIIKRTEDKKVKLLLMGKDLPYPIDYKEIEELLEKEQENKIKNLTVNNGSIKQKFKNLWLEGKKIFEEKKDNDIDAGPAPNCIAKDQLKDESIKEVQEKSGRKLDSNCKTLTNSDTGSPENILSQKSINNSDHPGKDKTLTPRMKIIKQKIIVLAKAKGGVGSTTIGIFLSSILKEFSVLLIDLNFNEGGGDISYYLNIPKSPNILNFLNGYSKEALDNSVIEVRENLHILQPPPTFEQSKKIELQDMYCITDIAKKKYHILIVDLPNHLGDLWLGSIDLADLLILISDFSIGSMGRLVKINNRYLYKGLEKLLVLNMSGKQNGCNLSDDSISKFFDLKDYIVVAENKFLRQKTDFTDLDFSGVPDFFKLKNKVLEIISN
jgi:MinD-like ATPase involved in chromosome partitioning or flagellar assembly